MILLDLWLRVVDVPDSQPDSAHSNDRVLEELESFGSEGLLGVSGHDIPQFLLWIGVDSL